jgi:hypothetical protein
MDAVEQLNNVVEKMITLCEIRGELDEASNAKTERRLAELQRQYDELSKIVEAT